jgi:hypothetical protein
MRRSHFAVLIPALVLVAGAAFAQDVTETAPPAGTPAADAAPAEPTPVKGTDDAGAADDTGTANEDAADEEASSSDEASSSNEGTTTPAPTSESAPAEPAPAEPETPAADVSVVVDIVLNPEEDLDAEEQKARARADAANKAVVESQSVEKLAEKEAADKALAVILDKKKKEGFWIEKALTLGASGSGLYNQKFVGQVDGFALQAGAILNGMFALGYAGNEWHNTLTVDESVLATPTADLFSPRVTKSADNLQLLSSYNYRWSRFPYVGPYAQLRGQTQIFQSYVQPAADGVVVRRTFRDGRVQDESVSVGQAAFLTDFFEPLTITESVGAFIEPPTLPPWLVYGFKVGAAGQHVIVRDGFVVADDAATSEIELMQLSLSNSFGSEAEANVSGQITELFLWSVLARVYYPILILEETELDLVERTHLDLQTTLSLRLTKWLSADWVTKVRRQPFVLNDWQIQSQVLLTTGFSIL